MLDLYGVQDREIRDRFMRWVREGQQQGWWEKYSDVLRPGKLRVDHLDRLLALEADATSIKVFQSNVVPGLLQTREYARELLRTMRGMLDDVEIDRLVEVRMVRQQLLNRTPVPVVFHCVLDEAVLLRSVGGPDIMRAQLRHLLELDRANVTVRVLPLSSGPHPAIGGPFAVLEFEDSADRDVVYIESYAGGAYLEHQHDVEFHEGLFRKCEDAALGPAESATLIATRLEALG
jgi:hypothetical protein